jgi:formyl-CoA transferase
MHNVTPRLSATPGGIRWAGGALGEHNTEVYRTEMGLSCDELKGLQEAGVI